jgi:hypothetical protein
MQYNVVRFNPYVRCIKLKVQTHLSAWNCLLHHAFTQRLVRLALLYIYTQCYNTDVGALLLQLSRLLASRVPFPVPAGRGTPGRSARW